MYLIVSCSCRCMTMMVFHVLMCFSATADFVSLLVEVYTTANGSSAWIINRLLEHFEHKNLSRKSVLFPTVNNRSEHKHTWHQKRAGNSCLTQPSLAASVEPFFAAIRQKVDSKGQPTARGFKVEFETLAWWFSVRCPVLESRTCLSSVSVRQQKLRQSKYLNRNEKLIR